MSGVDEAPLRNAAAGGAHRRAGARRFGSRRHEATVATIRDVLEAHRRMREALRVNERMLERAIRLLDLGNGVAGTLAKLPTDQTRRTAAQAEAELVRARHELRLAVFAAGLEEGMTIAELSRCWGFSRQLGARYAKELRSRKT